MTSFNLYMLIRDVVNRSSTPDRYQIAKEVLVEIPVEEFEGILAQLLPHEVGRVQAQERNSFDKHRINRLWNMSPLERSAQKALRSRQKEPWADLVNKFLSASAPFDINKFVRDMTKEDCKLVSQRYQEQARHNLDKAKTWEELAAQLEGKTTLAELPLGVVAETLAKENTTG